LASNDVRTILGILLLSAAVVAGHLVPGLDNSEFEIGIRNALHVLIFATFALIIFEWLKHLSIRTTIIATLAIIAMVGGLAEFTQFSHGKQVDLSDLGRDLTGAVLCLGSRLLWRWSFACSNSRFRNDLYRVGSALLALLIISPLLYWLTVIGMSRSTFPVILSFDHWWDTHLYSPVDSKITISATGAESPLGAGAVAVIRLSGRRRSGLTIRPVISDWSDYEYLTIEAAMVKGPDTSVTVRVFDEQGIRTFDERHVARLTIFSEPVVFRLRLHDFDVKKNKAKRRPLDLSEMRRIVIFARDRRDGTVMLLDEIRLE